MAGMFNRFDRHYFELLFEMTRREFTVRYKRTFFGFLWIILNPGLQMVIIGTIFSNFIPIPNYFLFLFSGLLVWQFFSQTIHKATSSFVNQRYLINKSVFPREVVPISINAADFLHLLIAELVFIAVILFLFEFSVSSFLLVAAALLWTFVLAVGVSLLASSLNVRFRDVAFFVQSILLLWFYASPVLYGVVNVPITLEPILQLNPLVSPLSFMHTAFLSHSLPDMNVIVINLIISLALLLLGIIVFKKENPKFSDWM
jgi:lipopolysaccharide transport system permease protein